MPGKVIQMMAVIATPADGLSLGVAPSGTCTWMSLTGNLRDVMKESIQAANAYVRYYKDRRQD